jgi:hypothetical protein
MTPASRRCIVIHAHFYQPPREDPWIDQVEREPNAAPFHDWNERIERECYRAVLAARVPGADGYIRSIVNTLEWISFNFGPTLLEWMEHEAPTTYRAILAADRASTARLGYGNAIATPYHHVILPLLSRREKAAELRLGISDFRRRYGREPVGMWLPETAVDEDTLDAVAAEGIGFVVLAPHQLAPLPPAGRPGLYTTSSGRRITLVPYDGATAHDVAFGPLIKNAAGWSARWLEAPLPAVGPALFSIATDGETYGHHHRFGEMALAATIRAFRQHPDTRVENYASFLAHHPATDPVTLVEGTSWSCAHGVERWRSDCGCRMEAGTSQAWRAPLRAALEWLGEELHAIFATEAAEYFADPWTARTTYAILGAPSDVAQRGRELIELERNAMRMFTSCGWFFDDLAGIETLQILKYAARAIDLAGDHKERLERGLLERLARAKANRPADGTGEDLYRTRIRPRWPAPIRVAAGYAAVTALAPGQSRPVVGGYLVGALGDGMVQVQHRRTGQTDRFAATTHRGSGFRVEVDLTHAGTDGAVTAPLEAFPERERELAREVLRREALREVFSAEELVRLAHGSASYPDTLRAAVTRLVPEQPGDASAATLARLERVLDLVELEGLTIPFDAQTKFYRLRHAADPAVRARLTSLAARLGFTRDAFTDADA